MIESLFWLVLFAVVLLVPLVMFFRSSAAIAREMQRDKNRAAQYAQKLVELGEKLPDDE